MNEFPRIPYWVPLTNPKWRETLLERAESIRNEYRPKRGWIMDKQVGRKNGND